jgi:PAS domain S-box-containing protein
MEKTHNGRTDQRSTTLESRLRLVIDTIPEQVWSALPDGSVDFVNQRWQEYTGLSLEEGLGWGATGAVHPEDLPMLMDDWRRAVASGEPFEKEARFRRADGEYRWFLVRAVPLQDELGSVVKWYGTSIDIEDRKQGEQIRAAQAHQASVRADVSAAFSKPAALRVTLRECVEAIVRHIDAAFARIWTLNKDQETLELQASAGIYTHLDGPHSRIQVGKLKIGLIAREKKPHLTNDVLNDPRLTDKDWARGAGIVSFAGYPLIVEDRLVGVVAMFARTRLSADILDLLASVADLIAQGIDRKRTEEELRESQAQLRMRAEQALEETGLRLAAQSKALTELTATQARGALEFDKRLRGILESCARTLGVERVSVWEFSKDRSSIGCVDLFESTPARHTFGVSLPRDRYPEYFAALERERLIAASDAHVDERTREFSVDYLLPSGIGAMLDVPLRQDDVTLGVLCLEHVGGARSWSADERNFALSVANLVAAASADEDRRLALRRLADSEELARLVVDTAHDAFIGMGPEGSIVSWNAQAEATFGWSRAEVIGRPLVETIIPVSFREAHLAGLRRFHESGEAPVVGRLLELTGLHRDGREFSIEITISRPITRGDGFFFGAFLRDISDRRRREEELRQAKDSAEAAARAKSEFLAHMSHELRTPLNGVLGYAQLLRRDRSLPAGHQEAVDAIAGCGAHLLALINDVLDLSKIEAGKIELEPVATDLRQLVADVRQLIAESARRKGLGFEIRLAADLPRLVVLDGRYLRQILINLLGNAVKFTHQGGVALAIARKDGRLRFDVSDTGIGIDAGSLGMIFEAFGQTRAGAEEGGTGLGLTISRRLVSAMGGELQVESRPERGSRFWFDFPLVFERGEEEVASQIDDVDSGLDVQRLVAGQEVTALVVDDHSINRRIMAVLLESMGVQTITAAGGTEGIELARRHCPEIILMDLRMKGMDGIEATHRLQADAATASIPVLAITASPFEDARDAALAAGCREFLAKPVRAVDLIGAFERHLGARFEKVVAPVPPAEDQVDDPQASATLAVVAESLREAAAIGSVSDLRAIALELIQGDTQQARLGQRIARLVDQFEFDAIERLASGGHINDDAGEK